VRVAIWFASLLQGCGFNEIHAPHVDATWITKKKTFIIYIMVNE